MAAQRVMLDTSVIRDIEASPALLRLLQDSIASSKVEVVVCRTGSEQLWRGSAAGHGGGVPRFPVSYCGNTVARVGMLAVGDSLGKGEIFDSHFGEASSDGSLEDALIVDAAAYHADVFVSNDNRQRRRADTFLPRRLTVLDLSSFIDWLTTHQEPA